MLGFRLGAHGEVETIGDREAGEVDRAGDDRIGARCDFDGGGSNLGGLALGQGIMGDKAQKGRHDGDQLIGREAGVAINFFRDGEKMRFELRPSALKNAGIQASYKLLSLARVVGVSG